MSTHPIDPALDLTEWDSVYRLDQRPKAGDLLVMMLPEELRVAPPGWTRFAAKYAWRIAAGYEVHFPFPVLLPPASLEFMTAP